MPVISIIVPVYKVESYLRRCIDSILSQTFADFECILIDDGSPDNCPAICDEYAEKDNRIVVIHQENQGSSAARNAGLLVAQGEWVGFVDSDDRIEHDMFEKLHMKAISENYDMVWCDFYHEDHRNCKYVNAKVDGLNKIDVIKKLLCGHLHGNVWNKLIKKTLYSYNNIYFPCNNQLEDLVFTIQNVYYAENIGYINKALYHYQINMDSLCFALERAKQRVNESYNNLLLIMNFLEEKYGNNLISIEPELSCCVNYFKISMLRVRATRDKKTIFLLKPDSHKYIFDKKSLMRPIFKILLFLATRNIVFPFKVLDIFFPDGKFKFGK